jgi:tetratricopeptide (TPR) repeat protein
VVGLLSRVGAADETLVRAGLTHLVEHLALPPAASIEAIDFNGSVDATTTSFWASGDRDAALRLIVETAARLSDPPVERISRERSIVRAEAATRSLDSWRLAMSLRFGPRRHGLVGYDELALHAAADHEVVDWARTRFTKQASALCMNGKPPDGLEIALLEGAAHPPPEPLPIEYVTYPAVFPYAHDGTVALSLLVDRTYATMAVLRIGVARLRQQLRYQLGTSYGVDFRYEPLDCERAHVLVWADALAEGTKTTRDQMIGALEELAYLGPTPAELERDYAETRRDIISGSGPFTQLWAEARAGVYGMPAGSFEEDMRELREVEPQDAADALAAGLESTLLLLPTGTAAPGGRFSEYPLRSPRTFDGRRLKPVKNSGIDPGDRLLVGDDGVALEGEGWSRVVPFDSCLALQRWDDGSRGVWSDDGFFVLVEPWRWQKGDSVSAAIDAAVPPALWVEMSDRPTSVDSPELDEALASGDVDREIGLLRDELERRPGNVELWHRLVRALARSERWDEALEAADAAKGLDPRDWWAHGQRGLALVRLGHRADAIAALSESVRLSPGGERALVDAAWLISQAGDHRRAERYATRAVELHPEGASAWFALAAVHDDAGDLAAAEPAYRRALELEPETSMWHNSVGWLLIRTGRMTEGLAALRRAFELDPSNKRAQGNLATAYALSGRRDEATTVRRELAAAELATAKRDSEAQPMSAAPARREAAQLIRLGRPEEALAAAHRALALDPASPDSIELALHASMNTGRQDDARSLLHRLVAASGRREGSFADAAEYAALLDEPDVAAAEAVRYREVMTRPSEAERVEGYGAAASGDWDDARRHFRAALARRSTDCCAQTWLGLAESRLGHRSEAVHAAGRAEALAMCECAARRALRGALKTPAPGEPPAEI